MLVRTAKDIGIFIRATRRSRQWSQATLATRAGTTQKWISAVENGRPGAPVEHVLRVLTALGASVNLEVPSDAAFRHDELLQRALNTGKRHE